jgi:hypothetical protein
MRAGLSYWTTAYPKHFMIIHAINCTFNAYYVIKLQNPNRATTAESTSHLQLTTRNCVRHARERRDLFVCICTYSILHEWKRLWVRFSIRLSQTRDFCVNANQTAGSPCCVSRDSPSIIDNKLTLLRRGAKVGGRFSQGGVFFLGPMPIYYK